MNNLTSAEKSKLIDISNKLKINPNLLWAVIQFESGWDPNSKNVNSFKVPCKVPKMLFIF